jgi:hypothetical protein
LLSALARIPLLFSGASGKQKIKQVLCVLSVSAVKMNIKIAPFSGFSKPPFLGAVFDYSQIN